jgi:hypothetical protein
MPRGFSVMFAANPRIFARVGVRHIAALTCILGFIYIYDDCMTRGCAAKAHPTRAVLQHLNVTRRGNPLFTENVNVIRDSSSSWLVGSRRRHSGLPSSIEWHHIYIHGYAYSTCCTTGALLTITPRSAKQKFFALVDTWRFQALPFLALFSLKGAVA